MQLYVIKFGSDLSQVAGFLLCPPPTKTDRPDITETVQSEFSWCIFKVINMYISQYAKHYSHEI